MATYEEEHESDWRGRKRKDAKERKVDKTRLLFRESGEEVKETSNISAKPLDLETHLICE